MSDANGSPRTASAPSLQSAFDRAAESMDLRLEGPGCAEEVRTLGIAFIPINKVVDVDLAPKPEPVGEKTDREIEQLIHGYEALSPEEFVQSWKKYAHDPHTGIGTSWVSKIDTEVIDIWYQSQQLADSLKDFPPHSPRQVKVSEMRIVYIGNTRAAATYRVEETYRNGKVAAGNSAVVLIQVEHKGWRILTATKGGRTEVSGRS